MASPPEVKMKLHEFQDRMAPILQSIENKKHKRQCLRFFTGFIVGVVLTFGVLAFVAMQSMP